MFRKIKAKRSAKNRKNSQRRHRALIAESLEPRHLLSAVTPGDVFLVNSYVTDHQSSGEVAMNPAGDFIAAWNSEPEPDHLASFYGQRFAVDSTRVGTELAVSANSGDPRGPSIATSANGSSVVLFGNGGTTYFQLIDSSGAAVGSNVALPSAFAYSFDVAMDASGGFVVVGTGEAVTDHASLRRFSATGTAVGDLQNIPMDSSSGLAGLDSVKVTQTTDGRAVAIWVDYTSLVAYAQRFDTAGVKVGERFQVSDPAFARTSSRVDVAMDDAGNFVAVYDDSYAGGQIFAQRFDQLGEKLGGEFEVSTSAPTNGLVKLVLASDSIGNFVAVWQDSNSLSPSDTSDIFARRFAVTGATLEDPFKVGEASPGDKFRPSVAMDASGDFIITWDTLNASKTGDADVFAQRFEENDAPEAHAGGPYTALEGETITLSAAGTFDEDGEDPLMYRWDFESDGTWDTEYSSNTDVDYAWPGDFTGKVTVEVSDGQAIDTAQTDVTVTNVLPKVRLKDIAVHLTENVGYTFEVMIDDPGGEDEFTLLWDFGDGTTQSVNAVSGLQSFEHVYAADSSKTATNSYPVSITVTDKETSIMYMDSANVTVLNAPPNIEPIPTVTANANDEILVYVAAKDAPGDMLTYRFDFDGDGVYETENTTGEASHTYTVNNAYAIAIEVADADGGITNTSTIAQVGTPPTIVPVVTFEGADPTYSESEGTIDVIVNLSESVPTQSTVVPIELAPATASVNDYRVANAFVVIPAGETRGTLKIELVDDTIDENSEMFKIRVGFSERVIGDPANFEHTITIEDNDEAPSVSFGSISQSVSESDGEIELLVTLSEISGRNVTVPLLVDDLGTATIGDDFTIADSTVMIPAGSRFATTSITLVDDMLPERLETIVVQIDGDNLVGASLAEFPIGIDSQTIFIEHNDAPQVFFTSVNRRVLEGVGKVEITAKLSAAYFEPITVPISISGNADATDFVATPATEIVFAADETEAKIMLDILADDVAEDDEQILVALTKPNNAMLGFNGRYLLTVRDDDHASISFTTEFSSVYEDEAPVTITAQLSNTSASDVTVDLVFAGNAMRTGTNADYAASATSLTIPKGQTMAQFTIDPINDSKPGNNRNVSVSMANIVGAYPGAFTSHNVRIADDDPTVSFRSSSTPFSESQGKADVYVSLSSPTNKPVTVNFVVQDKTARKGSDYTMSNVRQVVIEAGLFEAIISADIIDDIDFEGGYQGIGESFFVTLTSATNATLGATPKHEVVIVDNDSLPRVYFEFLRVTLPEGIGFYDIKIKLSKPADKPVTVDLNIQEPFENAYSAATFAIEGEDYAFHNKRVTIPVGEDSGIAKLQILDDLDWEPLEYLRVFMAPNPTNATFGTNRSAPSLPINIRPSDEYITVCSPAFDLPEFYPVGTLAIEIGDEDNEDNKLVCNRVRNLGTEILSTGEVKPVVIAGESTLVIVQGGVLSGSTMFFDANKNGILDFPDYNGNNLQDADEPSEFAVLTTSDGLASVTAAIEFDRDNSGEIEHSEGQLVVIGGTDVSTGLPAPMNLTAPIGAFAVGPQTTLMAGLMNGHGFSFEDAKARVAQAFALPTLAIETFNPINEIQDGNLDAARFVHVNAQIEDTVVQLSAFLAALDNELSNVVIQQAVVADMVAKIVDADSQLDLSEEFVIQSVLEAAIERLGLSSTLADIEGTAKIVAAGNESIVGIPLSADAEFLSQIARVQTVAQSVAATRLSEVAAGNAPIADAITEFTGAALDDKIAAAVIGDPLPPTLVISDALQTEGNDGKPILEFSVVLDRPSTKSVSVAYQTTDYVATVADSDYEATSGTLTWEPGDNTTKKIQVSVLGDIQFERDEAMGVRLLDGVNAAIRRDFGIGLILNDDAWTHAVPLQQKQTDSPMSISSSMITSPSCTRMANHCSKVVLINRCQRRSQGRPMTIPNSLSTSSATANSSKVV